MTERFETPILLLIFNRPDTTGKVFNLLREIKPAKLFISGDGARSNKSGEKEKVEQAREITKTIDWECDVKYNFSDTNLGCKKGVSSGINWFFENVSSGIIIEDDVLPDKSFFGFCGNMLEKYEDDVQVMHIGGANFQDGIKRGEGSYYFSKLCHVWGWASWARAWEKYNVRIDDEETEIDNVLNNTFTEKGLRDYYRKYILKVKSEQLDTWDYQWAYSIWKNNGVSIIPNKNLTTNIGFGGDATHTLDIESKLSEMKSYDIGEIFHPVSKDVNGEADIYTYKTKLKIPLINKIKSIFK